MLPGPKASLSESTSAGERNPLRRSIHTLNSENQFVCHTLESDSSPKVLIHLPEAEKGQTVFLYNRCGKSGIPERIYGIRVYASEDGHNWNEVSIHLDAEQVFDRKPIPVVSKDAPKYIMLRRDRQGDPIHISQIIIGSTLDEYHGYITQYSAPSHRRFAGKHQLKVNEQGWIYDRIRKNGLPSYIKPIWSSEFDIERGVDSISISV